MIPNLFQIVLIQILFFPTGLLANKDASKTCRANLEAVKSDTDNMGLQKRLTKAFISSDAVGSIVSFYKQELLAAKTVGEVQELATLLNFALSLHWDLKLISQIMPLIQLRGAIWKDGFSPDYSNLASRFNGLPDPVAQVRGSFTIVQSKMEFDSLPAPVLRTIGKLYFEQLRLKQIPFGQSDPDQILKTVSYQMEPFKTRVVLSDPVLTEGINRRLQLVDPAGQFSQDVVLERFNLLVGELDAIKFKTAERWPGVHSASSGPLIQKTLDISSPEAIAIAIFDPARDPKDLVEQFAGIVNPILDDRGGFIYLNSMGSDFAAKALVRSFRPLYRQTVYLSALGFGLGFKNKEEIINFLGAIGMALQDLKITNQNDTFGWPSSGFLKTFLYESQYGIPGWSKHLATEFR